jgi:hypothetical protein
MQYIRNQLKTAPINDHSSDSTSPPERPEFWLIVDVATSLGASHPLGNPSSIQIAAGGQTQHTIEESTRIDSVGIGTCGLCSFHSPPSNLERTANQPFLLVGVANPFHYNHLVVEPFLQHLNKEQHLTNPIESEF